ncbi:MAG TPA: Ig-like domain-containing protein, partial [Mycobacteriales bacterium]|nr:Ig-like domain-containing protein [Mycobacteriales bacterium]
VNSSSNVSLTWSPATDTSYGVACYTVARNGSVLGTTMATSFTDMSANTLTPTQYTVTARDGAGNVGPAAAFSITPPITTVSSSAGTTTYGSPVTFTATVTSQDGGTPTGTVVFKDGGSPFGSGTLDGNGNAQFTTSTLPVGSHSITAAYQGDATFPPSASSAITETVNKADSSTALSTAPNPSGYGTVVSLTATVTGAAAPPTGTVTFTDGSSVIGSAALNGSGQAQMQTSSLTIGKHTLGAAYAGDGNYNPSSGTTIQTVDKAATQTVVTSSANPAAYGSPVTFTATVSAGAVPPNGIVTFKNGRTTLGSVSLDPSGQATLTTSALTQASNSITASYAGSTNFLASTSPPFTQSLANVPSAVSLHSSRNPVTAPNSVTFTATVSSGGGAPTGTVEFFDGSASLGSAPIAAGKAALTVSSLTPGGHLITAHYNGDPNFAASTSPVVFQRVYRTGAVTSKTSLTNTPSTSTPGQPVTLAATVAGSGGPPTGTVWFFDNGNLIGQATLDTSGHASITVSTFSVGRHKLTVGYGGDPTFNPGISTARTQTVKS